MGDGGTEQEPSHLRGEALQGAEAATDVVQNGATGSFDGNDSSKKLAQRLEARVVVEDRRIVSDERHEGEVLQVMRSFAWVRPLRPLQLPEDVQKRLQNMNDAVRRKAKRKSRKPFCGGTSDNVVYVGHLDVLGQGRIPALGSKVMFKVYMDVHGVGGCEVCMMNEPIESMATPPVDGVVGQDAFVGVPPHNGQATQQRLEDLQLEERQPRYMEHFAAKVESEERVLIDGRYEGVVLKRSRVFAWVKPLDQSTIPAAVQAKLQEMNDRFRKKALEGGRVFCDGIEENVIYVANPDLVTKDAVLLVGMKVGFRLYTDNKGVGGCEVIPSAEHIEKVVGEIQKHLTMEEGKGMTLNPVSIFGSRDDGIKDVLFVGECTHAFTVAAGRILGVVPAVGAIDCNCGLDGVATWCSSELRWPREDSDIYFDLADNLRLLRSHGVWCSDGVDAMLLQSSLRRANSPCTKFGTVVWMLPYVPSNVPRPPDSIAVLMHRFIVTFVASAACLLRGGPCLVDSESTEDSVVVVVSASQMLSWDLRQPVKVRKGSAEAVLSPEVLWFDISQFEQHGYRSRFGDGRDRYVDRPVFGKISDLVAVRWRFRPVGAIDREDGASLEALGVSDADILERKTVLKRIGQDDNGVRDEAQN